MTPGQMSLYLTDFQGQKAARLMRVRGMMRPLLALWIWLAAALVPALAPVLAAAPLQAAESGWVGDATIGEARLVSAVAGTGDLDHLPLGLEFTLAPGWKIYWRTPGEAGLAPVLYPDDAATPGIDLAFSWPLPTRFDAFGFDNFGYENAVILPITLSGFAKGAAVSLSADLEALVCKDICVPLQGRLFATIPAGPATPTSHAQAIAQYAAMVPRPANSDGISASAPDLEITAASISRDGSGAPGLLLQIDGLSGQVRDIFVEGVPAVAFKAPQPRDDGLFMKAVGADIPDLRTVPLTVTVDAPPQAGAFLVTIGDDTAPGQPSDSALERSLLGIMLIAVLGGLILNLMPCVLPVLAIKLSAVLATAGAGRRELRLRFLAGAAGIMVSFMLLAGGLALVRIAGGTVGWGIQFQNPIFLMVMIVMIGLFALSLVDGVRFAVPGFVQDIGRGSDGGSGGGSGYRQDFLTGMLATILATPCSAPFVGTAVAAALSGGMGAHFVIFAAMGAGLAAPWMLVAAFPATVGLLPRPGPWMVWMKRVLALLLAGTMIWLMTVLAGVIMPTAEPQRTGPSAYVWQPWSPAAMQEARAASLPVFVDVTADWCITCKANKALVLERDPVASVLARAVADGKLVLLQADWTRPDPEIAAFLATHGRFGIPFNIIYSPAQPDGEVLSELLQARPVLRALETAGISAK